MLTAEGQDRREDQESEGARRQYDDGARYPHGIDETLREDGESCQGRGDGYRTEQHGMAGRAPYRGQSGVDRTLAAELLSEP